MEGFVKGVLQVPTRRDLQARATRRRIIDAATELFLRQGYAATKLDQIAGQAEVAVQTVYFHFNNKRTILKEVVDVASVGDDLPVALLDRPWVQQMVDAPDAPAVVAIWMHTSRAIFARVAPIMIIVRDAASNDPDMAAQWEINQEQRHIAHRLLAQQLADRRALRAGLSVEEATDILFALISLELYVLLTIERRWPPSQWERWCTDTVVRTVLRPGR
jgi:AcrR family transcriptional regulator